jgi:hypothetical protein
MKARSRAQGLSDSGCMTDLPEGVNRFRKCEMKWPSATVRNLIVIPQGLHFNQQLNL